MKTTFFVKTALLALSVALFAPFASASSFAITFSGSDASNDFFSGTLIGHPDGSIPGAFDITDSFGSVTRNASGLTLAIDPTASAFHGPWNPATPAADGTHTFFYDDIYYGSGDADGNPFDGAGLLFVLSSGSEVNLYCIDNSTTCYFDENDGFGLPSLMTFTVSNIGPPPVPEPGSLLLFGTGVLGLAGVVRRRLSA